LKSLPLRLRDANVSVMSAVLISLLAGLASTLGTRTSLQVEILALRHQLAVLQRTKRRRVPLRAMDRLLWVALIASGPSGARPSGDGYRMASTRIPFYSNWKSRRGLIGRPGTPMEVRTLIRDMNAEIRPASIRTSAPVSFSQPPRGHPTYGRRLAGQFSIDFVMDTQSADWLNALRAEGPVQQNAQARLHSLLLRVARAEVARRGRPTALGAADLDDMCTQAANDALLAVMRKLDTFKGLSRFTTWASKFVMLEVSSRFRRNAWRDRRIEWSDAAWEKLPDASRTADRELEEGEQFRALRRAVSQDLTDRQRMILAAAVLEGVPIDVLAERLGSSRGAIYKTLHDARAKLRGALAQVGPRVVS
jgi:RNA polymerase sigma-70 factor, ECF subfamily